MGVVCENWRVDASIDTCACMPVGVCVCGVFLFVFCVCFFRAYGGCLGMLDEGRVRLRYASGSCQQSVDPRMSEWGNLATVMCGDLQVNA